MRRQNNYRLVPRYLGGGGLSRIVRRFEVPVVKFVKKTLGKGKGKKFNYGNAKGRDLHAKRLQNVEDEYAEIYRHATPREREFMRRTGQTPDQMPVKFDPKNEGKLTTTKKPANKPTGETGAGKKPGASTGASAGTGRTGSGKTGAGKHTTGVPRNRALVPRGNTLPTPPANTPPVNPAKLSLSDKLKWGAGAALLLGTAALLSGDNNDSEEISTAGTNDLGEDTPQLVNNFGHVDDTDLTPTPNPAQLQQDPTLQTNPRDISTSTPVGNTNANPSTQNTAGTQGAAQNTVVQTTVPVASPFPEGYVIDRRGVRHQLDRIADGAYGSNTYELVIGLENTPDSNPFKRALMNRLGMSVWNSNEAYNRLAQMGIRGYIGGRDRKRLRNLINSGTNINGEINGFKTGGKLKLVKRYV